METQIPTRTLILNEGLVDTKREEILQYFKDTFEIDEKLFDAFANEEAMYMRADPLRHPLIFYFGHTAVFFINKLNLAKIINHRINPKFESMFAIGVDEMSWDDLNTSHYEWPPVHEVREYRKKVKGTVEEVIRTLPLNLPINWESPFWVIMMGIEHARIHLETSSVLIRQLPLEYLKPINGWQICKFSGEPPTNQLINIPAGTITLGKKKDHPLYGWDNEYGYLQKKVQKFKAAQFLTSNREFLGFIDENGYHTKRYWTEEGWKWVNFEKAESPRFWIKDESGYRLRLVWEEVPMPWNWPVELNYLEAKAFCNWKSEKDGKKYRLPSEEEWHRMHDVSNIPDQPYWDKAPGNINLEHHFSPCPVDQFKFGELYDVIGNVWQWTESPINGLDGFEIHPYYDDFSTPTFDTRHNLIKGGSWISTGNEATRDARYAFRRHFYQHAGFRYIGSDHDVVVEENKYETDLIVSQFCEAHWGKEYFNVELFPKIAAEICLSYFKDKPKRKALDLGCATGRTTFELAREFDFVTGLDFSARFIRIAIELQEKGKIQYILPEEGDIISFHHKRLKDYNLDGIKHKVEFYQADATNLKNIFSGYDLVFCGNLIDRLYDPIKFLLTIHERINQDGLLVLASPYSWNEEYTTREKWLGGFRKDGEPVWSIDGLHQYLDRHFKLIAEPFEIPFVLRETKRKFQHTLSEFTIWEKIE